jgi:hypothetical protein
MGCGIASHDSYQVCYLWHRMVLTKAAGDAELVVIPQDSEEYAWPIIQITYFDTKVMM